MDKSKNHCKILLFRDRALNPRNNSRKRMGRRLLLSTLIIYDFDIKNVAKVSCSTQSCLKHDSWPKEI